MPEKEVCRVQGVQRRLQWDCLWEGAFTSLILDGLPSGTPTLDCCRDICLGLSLWAGELVMEWHTSLLCWNMMFSDCSVWGVLVSDHSVSPAAVMRGYVKLLKHKSGSWKTWPLFLRLPQPTCDFGQGKEWQTLDVGFSKWLRALLTPLLSDSMGLSPLTLLETRT